MALPVLLARIAAELADAETRAHDLQMTVAQLVSGHAENGLDNAAAQQLQNLDLLHQQIAALGLFLNRLADHAPHCNIPVAAALDGLTLADMMRRLSGQQVVQTQDHGDIDLF